MVLRLSMLQCKLMVVRLFQPAENVGVNSKIFLQVELPLAAQAELWLLIPSHGQSSNQPFFPWM